MQSDTEIPGDLELLVQARENIEEFRKGPVELRIVDSTGQPVEGASVHLRMKRHEFLFGIAPFEALADQDANKSCNISDETLSHWDDFRLCAAELFNFATLPVYWGSLETVQGQAQIERLSDLYDWCISNGMKTKAHPLIWCQGTPDWISSDFDELSSQIDTRIGELAAHFGPDSGRPFDFVDFLNEPTIQPMNFENPLALWMRELGGPGTVEMAYDKCRNFNMPLTGIINHFSRDNDFLELCLHLQEQVRPFRAVGLQSHQHSGTRPLWMFQKETDIYAANLDIPVHWTENSVLSGENRKIRFVQGKADIPSWPSTPEGEEQQAISLANQYTLLFGHPAVEAITQWNLTDATSWLQAPSGLLDRDLQPKPSYKALHELIRRQWWSDVDIRSDANGMVNLKIFRGDYELDIETAESRIPPVPITVSRKGLKMNIVVS